jgi:hypothetical protein
MRGTIANAQDGEFEAVLEQIELSRRANTPLALTSSMDQVRLLEKGTRSIAVYLSFEHGCGTAILAKLHSPADCKSDLPAPRNKTTKLRA